MSTPTAQSQADSSSSASKDDDVAIREAQLCMRRVVHTLDFVRAVRGTKGSIKERVQAVIDLLKADAARSDDAWLIDFSLTLKGTSTPTMFELIHFLRDSLSDVMSSLGSEDPIKELILNQLLPLGTKLLRSFDPATVDETTGNNTLHELSTHFSFTYNNWDRKLAELLLAHGVSVHARNKEGRTPLLQFAFTRSASNRSASGLRLLLTHNADLNAQDNDGNTLLHLLVKNRAPRVLEDLLGGRGACHVDWLLVNSAGRTAANLTAIQLALQQAGAAGDPELWLYRLVLTYQDVSMERSRPILQRAIESVLIPDLAALVLAYVDGSGKPFAVAPDPKDSADPESPKAAAAAGATPAQ